MCPVCQGTECRGGGNKKCVQRDPRPSRIAGIIDTYGGIRFVVSYQNSLKYHTRCDEVLIIVPGVKVHEPIAWGDIPGMIGRIEYEVSLWLERGEPNEPHVREAWQMYRLRRLEQSRSSFDPRNIVET